MRLLAATLVAGFAVAVSGTAQAASRTQRLHNLSHQ